MGADEEMLESAKAKHCHSSRGLVKKRKFAKTGQQFGHRVSDWAWLADALDRRSDQDRPRLDLSS